MRLAPTALAFVLTIGVSAGLSSDEAQAQSGRDPYRWCADYSDGLDGAKNCYFITLEQCRAAVSGAGGYCVPNPFYTGPTEDRPAQRRKS